jgi:hypothetical protein
VRHKVVEAIVSKFRQKNSRHHFDTINAQTVRHTTEHHPSQIEELSCLDFPAQENFLCFRVIDSVIDDGFVTVGTTLFTFHFAIVLLKPRNIREKYKTVALLSLYDPEPTFGETETTRAGDHPFFNLTTRVVTDYHLLLVITVSPFLQFG